MRMKGTTISIEEQITKHPEHDDNENKNLYYNCFKEKERRALFVV